MYTRDINRFIILGNIYLDNKYITILRVMNVKTISLKK